MFPLKLKQKTLTFHSGTFKQQMIQLLYFLFAVVLDFCKLIQKYKCAGKLIVDHAI